MAGRNISIAYRQTAQLTPYVRNARTHSEAQIQQIAESITAFGWTNPLLVDEGGGLIAGHGRLQAALLLGLEEVPTVLLEGLTEAQKRALILADNKLALNAGWDTAMLASELQALDTGEFALGLTGFGEKELEQLLTWAPSFANGLTDPDEIPAPPVAPVSRTGDVWRLGRHRLICGDSTDAQDVAKLMGDRKAALLHADPPYGMGKESDGIANDNLYGEKLDRFQMQWWATFRPFLESNGSAYIWGNAPDLWRLWYLGGLAVSERFELRNEIVWDKKSTPGMASEANTQYPSASERCLFFQFGQQFIGNVNADDFPETWEALRAHLAGEAEAVGIKPPDIMRVCGCGMYGHWFTRSQFCLVPEKHYRALQLAYPGHFLRPWPELKREWASVRGSARDVINEKLGLVRSYFDNAHASMYDVWDFPRVTGEERFGHATPKPVEMIMRVMRSSLPDGGLCAEPFAGTGSTLIAAEMSGRTCYAAELVEAYVDVVVKRWQNFTGKRATLEATGEYFPEEPNGKRQETETVAPEADSGQSGASAVEPVGAAA